MVKPVHMLRERTDRVHIRSTRVRACTCNTDGDADAHMHIDANTDTLCYMLENNIP